MTDTLSAVVGILIVLAIGVVAWRLARQVRRQSEGAYASDAPGISGRNPDAGQNGMSVTDQTLFGQHTTTRSTWNVASHGGDGSA